MKWRSGFDKVKHSLGRAYNTSMKVLSVTDRAHALLNKGFGVVEARLEPELRQTADARATKTAARQCGF